MHTVSGLLMLLGACLVIFSGLRRRTSPDVAIGCCLLGLGLFGHLLDVDAGLTWLADLFGVSIVLLGLVKIRASNQSSNANRDE